MEYTDDFLNNIVSVGLLAYPLSKILNVVDIPDRAQFIADFDNPASVVAQAYQQGIDKSDYQIDIKIYELAKSGDIKAMEMYNERKEDSERRAQKETNERNRLK